MNEYLVKFRMEEKATEQFIRAISEDDLQRQILALAGKHGDVECWENGRMAVRALVIGNKVIIARWGKSMWPKGG